MRNIFGWIYKLKPQIQYEFTSEFPERLDVDKVYIEGDKKNCWTLAFHCPCKCGEIIYLNLIKGTFPIWNIKIRNRKISIYPSIRRIIGCKSHFVLRKGKIIWIQF